MLSKRIIPCLDIKDGFVVKGTNFEGLKVVGEPLELAKYYSQSLADELVFLDISATLDGRKTILNLVQQLAKEISIPFTVGGGIRTLEDAKLIITHGADKVAINSAAISNSSLISEIASSFGSQAVVVAVDYKRVDAKRMVFSHSGKQQTRYELEKWIEIITTSGAGEILLTSIDADGTKSGFDCQTIRELTSKTNCPIIASGGAGTKEHFVDVFNKGYADAALAAGIFHSNQLLISDLKEYLNLNDVVVRV